MAAKAKEKAETRQSVSATAKHVRISARKLRLVADLVRGQDIARARTTLSFTPKGGAAVIDKLIASATANAENNHDMSADELFIKSIYVNEGPTMKRYRPRALGRAYRIRKRSSHVTVELASREEG
ncbi:MAG: 50S ribosomal protein L22 [Gaiellales bacterium]|nr:MAG: 50S ribosomal protein L22 [Gaiellales bacterium]